MLVVSPDEAADACCQNTEYRHISSVLERFYNIASCMACTGNLLVIYCLHLSYNFALQMLIHLGELIEALLIAVGHGTCRSAM